MNNLILLIILLFIYTTNTYSSINKLDPIIYKKLQLLEKDIKCKLFITSGYRTKKHNRKVGGARNSYHLRGKALDLSPIKCNITLYTLFIISRKYFRGVIKYPNHIHVDIRKRTYVNKVDKYEIHY